MAIDLVLLVVSAAIRALGLGLVTCAALFLFRIRSSAARHATWTVVLIGMLLQVPLGVAPPTVAIKGLPAFAAAIEEPVRQSSRASLRFPVRAPQALVPVSYTRTEPKGQWVWSSTTVAGAYLAVSILLLLRMALGFCAMRRLLRNAKPIPSLSPGVYQSDFLATPGSIGCFRPRILLPGAWSDWDGAKLRAVLAHERAHIRRRDWLIRIASQVNVCIFWFHPLAWWMQRELARLAEEAADDLALSEIEDREQYAAILVEIAVAAAAHRRILGWGPSWMASESNVIQRVNRILTRRLNTSKPLGCFAWATLFVCSLPAIYLCSAVKLASANRDPRVFDHPVVRGAAEAPVIVGILVHGNRSVPTKAIWDQLLIHGGDVYDQAAIDRTIKSLWNTGFFEDIRNEREAMPKGWIIHIYVRERRTNKEITPLASEQKSSSRLIAEAAPELLPMPRSPLSPREDTPITMCILLDNSGSMHEKRAELKAAAMALIKASKPQDEVSIVHFNDETFSGLPDGEDFTSDIKRMEEALTRIDARGGTAMRDAVQKSIDQLEQTTHHGRKVVVLVTDGNDSSSSVTQDQLLEKVRNSGVPVYSIGLLSKGTGRAGAARLALGQLAQASGGRDYYAKDLSEVESIAPEIANYIREQ